MTKKQMIFSFLKNAVHYFVFAVIFALLSSLTEMLRPLIIEHAVDGILGDLSQPFVWRSVWMPAVLVILCSLATVTLRYFYQSFTVRGSESFVKNMRDSLYEHILHLPVSWHSATQTGDIIQRCTNDVDGVKSFLSDQLVSLFGMILTIIAAFTFMFSINFKLTLAAALMLPILVVFSFWFHRKIGESFLLCDENEGVLSTIAQENLTGVRVIRAFGKEKFEKERFAKQNQITTDKWVNLGIYLTVFWSSTDLLTGLIIVVIMVMGCIQCYNGTFTIGGLLAIISYFMILIHPIRSLGRLLSDMSKTDVSLTRLLEIMNAPREEDVPEADEPEMNKDIEFSHVSFGYTGCPELLHDLSFTIPAGSTLGILGNTGCGKSTLAALLARLYPLEETQGKITVGGHDLQTMKAAWVRKNVGYVLQEPFLFSRSIAENIAITNPELSEEEIRKAAAIACFDVSASKFPKGFATLVGERGVTLSGGQKQRAAIARTLTLNAPILIFDDSLSAVDAETDALIRKNLEEAMGKATVILISHRISTLRAADNILVMEDGRITEQGSHDELISHEGLYRRIYEIQSLAEGDLAND